MASPTIAITGIGMVSSLALDAPNACAAARAGVSRAAELPFQVINRDTNDLEPVVGHAAAGMTGGFEGLGRLLRMVQLGLADLRHAIGEEVALLSAPECHWWLVLPRGATPAEETATGTAPPATSWAHEQVLPGLRAALGKALDPQQVTIMQGGHEGFAVALQQAAAGLKERQWQRCVVGAVDSLVDPVVLQALYEQGRLKAADNPVGVRPGEAGVFATLEPGVAALRRRVPILGFVVETTTGFEADHQLTGKPGLGRGLADVVARCTPLGSLARPPWLVYDHNGEVYRASEWGYALTRLVARQPFLDEAPILYPALSFGDTGAASGGVALCMVLQAFARGYAPANHALILSSADAGHRTGMLIRSFS